MATTEEYTEEEIQPLSSKVPLDEQKESEDITLQTSIETDDEKTPLQLRKDILISMDPSGLGDISLIDRAHSDPLSIVSKPSTKPRYSIDGESNTKPTNSNQNKRDSQFLSTKKYHSHDDIQLCGFQGLSIRELSVEVIPIKYDGLHGKRHEKKEEIVVPARDNLVKMPFFSTPLTLESTNNAFFDFKERLNEMGFNIESEAALVHTHCESVENAVTFILNNPSAIYHRFQTKISINELKEEDNVCCQCNKPFNTHLIDQNGNQIAVAFDDELMYIPSIQEEEEENQVIIEEETKQNTNTITITRNANTITISRNTKEIIDKTVSELDETRKEYDGATDECLICFDLKPSDYFSKTECGHDKYCKECLTKHYRIKTAEGDVLKVKCIDPSCEREVTESEIMNFLTDDALKDKFRKFKRQKLLMLNENARFCPGVDCEGYMIGSRLKPKLVCGECKTTICFNCSRLWHGYFTKCSSAQNASNIDQNDAKFFQWELNKKENVKKCPKCRIRIEKTEGCNHMTCVSCKYEFCWICKGKYDGNHFNQWNVFGCPGAQYSNRGSICSIQRCPRCFPMWFRRLLLIIAFILLLPIILVFGILGGCFYGCALCVLFVFEKVCCDC